MKGTQMRRKANYLIILFFTFLLCHNAKAQTTSVSLNGRDITKAVIIYKGNDLSQKEENYILIIKYKRAFFTCPYVENLNKYKIQIIKNSILKRRMKGKYEIYLRDGEAVVYSNEKMMQKHYTPPMKNTKKTN